MGDSVLPALLYSPLTSTTFYSNVLRDPMLNADVGDDDVVVDDDLKCPWHLHVPVQVRTQDPPVSLTPGPPEVAALAHSS